MIELLILAVDTAVREYTSFYHDAALIGVIFCGLLGFALSFGVVRLWHWVDSDDMRGIVTLIACVVAIAWSALLYDSMITLANPKAIAIHNLIKDIRR